MWIVYSAMMNAISSVGVVSPGMLPILVIGLRDCVGGLLGRSDWQDRLSRWAWLVGGPMSVCSAGVISPRGVRIVHIRSVLSGSSSLDAVPVTGPLLFYAPVCCLAVCCAAELSSNVLFGGMVCIWLAGRELFFPQVGVSSVMVADSAAAVGDRAGITFDVELVIPWDAPEAVADLHFDILMDLEIVPDVIGLTGWRPEAAACPILQGRDCEVCVFWCRFSGAGAECDHRGHG